MTKPLPTLSNQIFLPEIFVPEKLINALLKAVGEINENTKTKLIVIPFIDSDTRHEYEQFNNYAGWVFRPEKTKKRNPKKATRKVAKRG